MKLTQADVNEIMKHFSGRLTEINKADTKQLLKMVQQGTNYDSLAPAIATDACAEALTKGKGIAEAIQLSASAGVFVGLIIGYHLGLREAGLELGIPSHSPTTTENNLEEGD